MWLSRLDLLAFGRFSNVRLNLGPGFHLIYGPNEAGKSTTLRAIRQLLFGFDEQTTDNFLHKYANLRIGGTICGNTGTKLDVIRRKTKKESLRGSDDVTVVDDVQLQRALCGIDETTFSRRYGINHEQLIQGGREIATGSGDLGEILFATASGIKDLSSVQKSFHDEAADLFRLKGEKQRINAALKELKTQRDQVTEKLVLVTEWEEIDRQRREAQAQWDDVNRQFQHCQAERDRLEGWKLAWPHIQEQETIKIELDAFAAIPRLPENFSAMRQEASTVLGQANSREQAANTELSQALASLEKLDVPETLLAGADELTRMQTEWGSYSKAQVDRQGLVEQLDRLNASLTELSSKVAFEKTASNEIVFDRSHRARVGQLGRQQATLVQAFRQAEQHHLRLRHKIEEVQEELTVIPAVQPLDDLRQVARQARNDGDLLGRQQRLMEEIDVAQAEFDRRFDQMELSTGGLADLRIMRVPSASVIADCDQRIDANRTEQSVLRSRLNDLEEQNRKLVQQIAILRGQFHVPTEAELIQTRERRDRHWSELRTNLLSNERPNADLVESFERAMIEADGIADRLRNEADRAAQLSDQLSEESENEHQQHEISIRLAELEAVRINLEETWNSSWPDLSVAPRPPREIQTWLALRENLLQRDSVLTRRKDEADSLVERINHHISALNQYFAATTTVRAGRRKKNCLVPLIDSKAASNESDSGLSGKQKSFGWDAAGNGANAIDATTAYRLPPCDVNDLNQRLEQVEQLLEANEAQRRRRADAEERMAALKSEEFESASLAERAKNELEQWETAWRAAMADLKLPPDTSVDAASIYLETLSDLNDVQTQIAQFTGRIDGIDQDAMRFRLTVRALCQRMAPDLVDAATEAAVKSLRDRLSASQRDQAMFQEQSARKVHAEQQVMLSQEARARGKGLVVELYQAAGLNPATIEPASCHSDHSVGIMFQRLIEVEEQSRQRVELEEKLARSNERLQGLAREIPVDDFVNQVRQQSAEKIIERLRQIESEIPRITERQKTLFDRIAEIQGELKRMDGRADAAEAEEKQRITLAQIRSGSEQYVRVKLAAAILHCAIEKYREKTRGPVLKAASDLFRELTLDRFDSLRVDDDDRGKPVLVAVRAGSRETIHLDALSEGTCDQLYLALRLASLGMEAAPRNQLPFIVDDILIQFDDERAAAALRILARFAQRRQVIFFTHHERLLEIANKHLAGEFVAHRLDA